MKNKPLKSFILAVAILVYAGASTSLKSQIVAGQKVKEVAKKYDSHYVYKQPGATLFRAVFLKVVGEDASYFYTYCDSNETIKIVLDSKYSFTDENYWSIDTTLTDSYSDFSEGFATIKDKQTGLCGYIDRTGKVVITPQFTIADKFSEGLAYFALLEKCVGGETRPNKMGYINKQGERVIVLPKKLSELYACCYFKGSPFKNGVAILSTEEFGFDCNSGATLVIDRSGKVLNYTGYLLNAKSESVDVY
jgi:hypothetical protein